MSAAPMAPPSPELFQKLTGINPQVRPGDYYYDEFLKSYFRELGRQQAQALVAREQEKQVSE